MMSSINSISNSNFALKSISPIDGRYYEKTRILEKYFSEYALIYYRLRIEILYLFELEKYKLFSLPSSLKNHLCNLMEDKNGLDTVVLQIKKLELTTLHDVKAVELFLADEFARLGYSDFINWIHFGVTSQDINNTAIPLSLKEFFTDFFFDAWKDLIQLLQKKTILWQDIPMLAHTHGQAASPTILGKEIKVFSSRIQQQLDMLEQLPHRGKFGGAVGNFNAHHFCYPNINWADFANNFLQNALGLIRTSFTTQIEPYDFLAAQLDNLKRLNNILIDLCRDLWMYVSFGYFKQKFVKTEVGSSTMPHKINPIDFENAEGNLLIAVHFYSFLVNKLPISRLQRDLTDSTVLRNLGVPLAHTVIALDSLTKGLNKLEVNQEKIKTDLNNNWLILAEAVQSKLRTVNYPDPYNLLKDFTRNNQQINRETWLNFIQSLAIEDKVKEELLNLNPFNYTGIKH